MSKAYLFLRKLIALLINALVFIVVSKYNIPFYYSVPVLILIFSLICSRILGESPKELYNYKRSESFFAKGGLRDLLRIPVVLFAFIHDIVVWELWGIYQLLLILVDCFYFIKEIIFWLLHAIIWFLKQLVPFWRVLFRFIFFYFIKWPWWIYRYAFQSIKKTYNWNVLKISLRGTIIAMLVFQLFYFLDRALQMHGLVYIGIILSFLPISWVFGEIASVRGQKLMKENFGIVRLKFGNGIETVRGILFYLTFFVVLILTEAGLDLLGWLPKTGIVFLGIGLNISFFITATALFLSVLVVLGTVVLPSFRLYNEFNETNLKNTWSLLSYIFRRFLQIITGLVPSTFFAIISALPATLVVAIALSATLVLKNNVIDFKIDLVKNEQTMAKSQVSEHKLGKRIAELNYIKLFPDHFVQELENRQTIISEINDYKRKEQSLKEEFFAYKDKKNRTIDTLQQQINNEKLKAATNQTRIEELSAQIKQYKAELGVGEKIFNESLQLAQIDTASAVHKYKQIPLIFYLSSLFIAIVSILIFIFIFGYYGNFFYSAYIFRNDGTPAQWKTLINDEHNIDSRHPLLSVTLNIIILLCIVSVLFWKGIILSSLTSFF